MTALSITQDQQLTVLRSYILTLVAVGTEVILGQENRVGEPLAGDFVVMTPLFQDRIATNSDTDTDAVYAGSISGAAMTITGFIKGAAIATGDQVFGVGVTAGTVVTGGSGGIGPYSVSPSQTITSRTLSFGTHNALQQTRITMQLDVHGDASADNAQILSTMLRDPAACDFFAASGVDMQPLYVTDPRQAPFLNAQDQYENRWTLDAVMQANPVVSTGLQFADTVALDLVEVDATFPPA